MIAAVLLESKSWAGVMVASLALLGCGSDDPAGSGGNGGSGATGGSGASGGTGGGASGGSGPTISYSGVMNQLGITGQTPLPGAKVCIEGHADVCATTATDGAFTLAGVPANAELAVRASLESYHDSLTFLLTGEEDQAGLTAIMVSRATVGLLYPAAGFGSYDETKGSFGVSVLTPDAEATSGFASLEGASVTLVTGAGTGPVYASDSGIPDSALTATSKNGVGLYGAVTPGEVAVDAAKDATTCKLGPVGWPTASAHARGLVEADVISFVTVLCE